MGPWVRVLVVLVAVVGGVLTGATPAGAAPEGRPGAGEGWLRLAHLSPDTPTVDVSIGPIGGGDPVGTADALAYGVVTDPRPLPAGSYAVALRAAGAGPRTPALLSVAVDVPAGGVRTVAVSGPFDDLRLDVLAGDAAPPPAGRVRVRVVAAAADAPSLDVTAGGVPVATGLAFARTSGWAEVPAGTTTLQVTSDGTPSEVPVDLAAGSAWSLLVLDRPGGGLTVRPVLEAAGASVVPVGGVAAGGTVTAGTADEGTAPVVRADPGTAGAVPVRLRIPGIAVDAPLDPVGLDGAGTLAPPAVADRAGWYTGAPAPGAVGPAVVAGHVDSAAGPAVFWRLRELAPGDEVLVDRADGSTIRFTVTATTRVPKAAFPTAEVYGPVPGAVLRLVTCGGPFDRARGSYADNVVVTAVTAP
ncbi:class F sortase [Geodermatophilus sp. SYSU D00758]